MYEHIRTYCLKAKISKGYAQNREPCLLTKHKCVSREYHAKIEKIELLNNEHFQEQIEILHQIT